VLYRVLVWRSRVAAWRMWEDNIKLDHEGVHWIHVAQGTDK